MESQSGLTLNKQEEFDVLLRNPEGVRYYQDGLFFGVGCRYKPIHVPANKLPKNVVMKIRKRGGLRPIMSDAEIAEQRSDFRKFQADKEAFAREKAAESARIANELEKLELLKAELEGMKTLPVNTNESPVELPQDKELPSAGPEEDSEPVIYKCEHPGCTKEYKSKIFFDKHIKSHKE